MSDQQQKIIEKHKQNLEGRISAEDRTTLKDLKEQIIKTEHSIVSEIAKGSVTSESNNSNDIEDIINTFSDKQLDSQTNLLNIIDGFFKNVVDVGFTKDLNKLIPKIENFSSWYLEEEEKSQKRLEQINTTFENAINNASEAQIELLKIQHKATIAQEKKRFELEVKNEQQRKLAQSLADADGNITLDLLKRMFPSINTMSKSLAGIQESSKVWNQFKGEGFWKRLGGYLAYNDKGILGSIGDLFLMKGKSLLSFALIKPLKNIFGGLLKGGLSGLLGGMKGNMKAGAGMLKVGGLLTAGMGIFNAFDIEKQVKNGEMTREEANRSQASNAGGTVGAIAGGALGMLLGPIGSIVGAWLGEKIGSFIGEYIYDNWDSIVKWVSDTWDMFVNGIKWVGDKITGWWNGAINSVKNTWNSTIKWFKDLGNNIKNGFINTINGIGNWFLNLGQTISNKFWSIFNTVTDTVTEKVNGAVDDITGIWTSITDFCTGLWTNVTTGIKGAWDDVINFCKNPAEAMGIDIKVITDIFDNITGAISEWWDNQVGFVKKGWKDLKNFFGFGDEEEEDKKNQVETLKRQQPEIKIKKTNGKDISDAVISNQNNNNSSSIIQQNNVNNVNTSQTTLHQTPIIATTQPDLNLYSLGSGWNTGIGVIPM